mgnify:CR=1 FL=1
MKTKNLITALTKVAKPKVTKEGGVEFKMGKKSVYVIDQSGLAVGLPLYNGSVVHNGNHTIKNLVAFLRGDS